MQALEEVQGSLALTNILSAIWLGDWERYETIFKEMPEALQSEFPFHPFYNRKEVEIWYDNHFCIPGAFFIPPYISSYSSQNGAAVEESKKNLLCLIGHYEKMGFYYPLETNRYPDHVGCLLAFISSLLQEEIKAAQSLDKELSKELGALKRELLGGILYPILAPMQKYAENRVKHPFIKEFLNYFCHNKELLSLV
ncbi:molecular chaperone TorD family protein [Brevibacillus ginsengisoli]|uniref:molecular chaperone TorD family protein n=1 Tax=Brevibacillus ginsengisoli TaxID=363854 RepID=UPI003CF5A3BA